MEINDIVHVLRQEQRDKMFKFIESDLVNKELKAYCLCGLLWDNWLSFSAFAERMHEIGMFEKTWVELDYDLVKALSNGLG